MPVVLFHRLGRYIAISTATGDFYELPADTFKSLKKFNKEISALPSVPSRKEFLSLARKARLSPSVSRLFTLPDQEHSFIADRKTSVSITDLTLNLTSNCNLRCVYCWNDHGKYSNWRFLEKHRASSEGKPKDSRMSVSTALKAVDILVKYRGKDKDLVVDFYGGEPLLNLETLRATVDYCRSNQSKWKVNFHFLLATNGTLLTPEIAGELISKGVQIAVSIDGPEFVHDNNRPFTNRGGSFATITGNLKKMPPAVMKRLVGRTTVTPFFPDMVKLYENLRNLGFERIELFESEDACHKISPRQETSFFSTDESYRLLCKTYEKLALRYIADVVKGNLNYSKTFFNRFFKLMQRLYYNHEVSGGCPAAKGQIAVGIEGKIYPCTSFLGVKEFELGDVVRGIDKGKFGAFIEKINKRFDYCRQDCELFSLCRSTGSCLNVNYFFNGDPAMPHKRSCSLFAEKLSLAAASLAILSEKIPHRLEELFGFDPVGRRGNKLY